MKKEQKKELISKCIDNDMSISQIEKYISSRSTLDPGEWLKQNSKDEEFNQFLDEQFEDKSGDVDEIRKGMGGNYR